MRYQKLSVAMNINQNIIYLHEAPCQNMYSMFLSRFFENVSGLYTVFLRPMGIHRSASKILSKGVFDSPSKTVDNRGYYQQP